MGCQWLGCNYYTGKTGVITESPVLLGSAVRLWAAVVTQKWESRSAAQAAQGSIDEHVLRAAELTSSFCGLLFFQLLNQFENTGPPPADKEKIQALPTVQIAQEHVGTCISSREPFAKSSVKVLFDVFLGV